MKGFMLTVNTMIFIITIASIIAFLIMSQFGTAWLMTIPALYSYGNAWAISCDE